MARLGSLLHGVSEEVDLSGFRLVLRLAKLFAEQPIEEYRAAYGLKSVIKPLWGYRRAVAVWESGSGRRRIMGNGASFRRPLSYIGFGGTGKQVRDFLHGRICVI